MTTSAAASPAIVRDTHALVGWTQQPELLGRDAAAAIDGAGRIHVSTIALWEMALLVREGRLAPKRRPPIAEWAV